MSQSALKADAHQIVVDEIFPHAPEAIWRTLTTGDLISRWLMVPTGFEPVKGKQFTFQTTPAGAWDGIIHCEVLEVIPNQRLAYTWQSGDESNIGYGSRLNTVVAWNLTKVATGTRLQLVHSGFVAPKNDAALQSFGEGWKKVVTNIGAIANEQGERS